MFGPTRPEARRRDAAARALRSCRWFFCDARRALHRVGTTRLARDGLPRVQLPLGRSNYASSSTPLRSSHSLSSRSMIGLASGSDVPHAMSRSISP